MSGNWYNPGNVGAKRQKLNEQQIQAPPDPTAVGGPGASVGGAGLDMPNLGDGGGGRAPDMSKELQGQNNSDENKGKDGKDDKNNEKKDAPKNQRRRMQFMQYMRQENAEDRELVEEFGEALDAPSDWEREDHLDDLRPSIWFRKDQHVVEVYATLGNLAAVFGLMPPLNEGDKQDYTMMRIVFPPVKIPHMSEDEDTGEENEDFEGATETFQTFIEECADYIREQRESLEGQPQETNRQVMRPVEKGENK